MNGDKQSFDVVIVGSGLAAISAALLLPEQMQVAVLSKDTLTHNASHLAQGGIAAVLSSIDSIDKHTQDTLIAGAGLCDERAVRAIIAQSHQAIAWLCELDVPFTASKSQNSQDKPISINELHLTKEGGHSLRRICHVADFTGQAVMQTLLDKLLKRHNITIIEQCFAIDVLTQHNRCVGVVCIHQNRPINFYASQVILATGGLGQVYQYTTAPRVATGDGVAMAWRAGARIANGEFIQFHPTGLALKQGVDEQTPLISEAVRGEGGLLKNHQGERFMVAYDERLELAPRDVVARSITLEMQKHQQPCVYLDISHQPNTFIKSHFPKIAKTCQNHGIDMTQELIPVAPVQHYFCGGVLTDVAGRSDIEHLYCIGELACTGLHGANRLASNSLLECIVMAKNAVQAITKNLAWQKVVPKSTWSLQTCSDLSQNSTKAFIDNSLNRQEIQQQMQQHVGVIRQRKAVAELVKRFQPYATCSPKQIQELLDKKTTHHKISRQDITMIENINLATCAYLVANAAVQRQESVGCHYWQQ